MIQTKLVFKKWNFRYFICYSIFILLLSSLYQYLLLSDNNQCQMTFMFETPNFIPIPLPKKVNNTFSKYKIYLYNEGLKVKKLNFSNLNGIPAIFIPGSKGSYKQARSFGSISMKFSKDYMTTNKIDFFTIDFNEEISGVYGSYLKEQTLFLNYAIKIIKRLYNKRNNQKKVKLIVFAHSIGGLIFKGLINLKDFNLDDIFLFITLATPHRGPVFSLDTSFYNYYQNINQKLKNDLVINQKYNEIAKISIAGGINDNLVRTDLTTDFQNLISQNVESFKNELTNNKINSIFYKTDTATYETNTTNYNATTYNVNSTFEKLNLSYDKSFSNNYDSKINQWNLCTTSIPDVWLTADHNCIVWCKQLVKKIIHLVYDLLEESLLDEKLTNKKLIIDHHLNYRFNDRLTKRFKINRTLDKKLITKNYKISKRLFIYSKQKIIDTTVFNFKFYQDTYYHVISSNLYKSDWIFACKQKNNCDNFVKHDIFNLPLPSISRVKRNSYIIDSNYFLKNNYTKLSLVLYPSLIPTNFQLERIIKDRRELLINMPTFYERLFWFFNSYKTLLKVSIGEESTFYNLSLNNFNQIWQNYILYLEVGSCYDTAYQDAVLRMKVPWYKEDIFFVLKSKKDNFLFMTINLNIPKYDLKDQSKINLQLFLDPYCAYELKVKFSIRETIIQIYRHYSFLFLPITISILLNAYAIQIQPQNSRNFLSETKNFVFLNLNSVLFVNIFSLLPSLVIVIHFIFSNYGINFFYTSHNSILDIFFIYYLNYFFVYFILCISTHFLSKLFLSLFFIIKLILDRLHYNIDILDKLRKLFIFKLFFTTIILLSLFHEFCFIILILIYITKLIMISIQSYLKQQKIGLNKLSSKFYLDLTKFLILIFSCIPLIPKFYVSYTTNEKLDGLLIYFVKLAIITSFYQLFTLTNFLSIKKNQLTIYSNLIKIFSLVVLCTAHLNYSIITLFSMLTIILNLLFEYVNLLLQRNDMKID